LLPKIICYQDLNLGRLAQATCSNQLNDAASLREHLINNVSFYSGTQVLIGSSASGLLPSFHRGQA
jgi:hypothetical protein